MTIDELLARPVPQVLIKREGGFLESFVFALYRQIAKTAGADVNELLRRATLTIDIVPGSSEAFISLGTIIEGEIHCDEDAMRELEKLMRKNEEQ